MYNKLFYDKQLLYWSQTCVNLTQGYDIFFVLRVCTVSSHPTRTHTYVQVRVYCTHAHTHRHTHTHTHLPTHTHTPRATDQLSHPAHPSITNIQPFLCHPHQTLTHTRTHARTHTHAHTTCLTINNL